jgi:hypothetical protein
MRCFFHSLNALFEKNAFSASNSFYITRQLCRIKGYFGRQLRCDIVGFVSDGARLGSETSISQNWESPGEIQVALAVQSRVALDNLNADGVNDLTFTGFHDLKFGQTFFKVVRRKTHCFSDFFQRGQIIHGRGAHA